MASGSSDPGGAARSTPAVATEPWLRTGRIIELLAPAPGAKVLLVGDAEGLLASRLIREKAALVTWLEPAPPGAPASGPPGVPATSSGCETFVCDCCEIPFEAEEFDAVASQFTLEYLEDPAGALLEWRRVMKPGGALALRCPPTIWHVLNEAPFTSKSKLPWQTLKVTLQRFGQRFLSWKAAMHAYAPMQS